MRESNPTLILVLRAGEADGKGAGSSRMDDGAYQKEGNIIFQNMGPMRCPRARYDWINCRRLLQIRIQRMAISPHELNKQLKDRNVQGGSRDHMHLAGTWTKIPPVLNPGTRRPSSRTDNRKMWCLISISYWSSPEAVLRLGQNAVRLDNSVPSRIFLVNERPPGYQPEAGCVRGRAEGGGIGDF